jgi:hypothetical protein
MQSTSEHMRSKPIIPTRIFRAPVLIIILLAIIGPVWAQISLVHVTSCGPQTFPATCTIPASASGNLLVAGWTSTNGGSSTLIASVTDNVGNIYQEAAGARATDNTANTMADIWYTKSSLSGATVVTITPSPGGTAGTGVIWEFSGIDTTAPLDQTAVLNSQSSTTTTAAGASVVATSPGEVVVSLANVQGNVTGIKSGSAFSNDSTAGGDGWAHLIASAAGIYAPQWNTSAAGSFESTTASFRPASAGGGACDLNRDGVVNVVDVQLAVNMDLGLLVCPLDLNLGICNSALVQQVLNAALGAGCSATISHSVSLGWTASASANVAGYNVYRSSTSGGPFTKLNSSLVITTSFTDSSVLGGQNYYYVTTAVDTGNNESIDSNQAQAAIPSP